MGAGKEEDFTRDRSDFNVIVPRHVAWDPAIAAGERHKEVIDEAA